MKKVVHRSDTRGRSVYDKSGTVLAWKKTEVLSATAAALLRFAEKYVGGISDHPV